MFCITFQAVIELPMDNLIVYRKVQNLGNYNYAIYYKSYILPDELCLNKFKETFLLFLKF